MLGLAGGFTPTTVPGMHRLGGLAFTQTGLNYKTGMLLGSPFIAIHNGLRTGAFLLSIGQRALECHNPHFISGSGFRRGGRLGARGRQSSLIRGKSPFGPVYYNRLLATGLLELSPERLGNGGLCVDFGAKLIDNSMELLLRFLTDARLEISALSDGLTGKLLLEHHHLGVNRALMRIDSGLREGLDNINGNTLRNGGRQRR